MNQRLDKLDLLAPLVRDPALRFIQRAQAQRQVTLGVVWTWRAVAEQQRLWEQGRTYDREQAVWVVTDENAVVTNAKPGRSAHNVVTLAERAPAALAVDLMPLRPDGEFDWVTGFAFWQPLYDLAWQCGLDPLGDTVGAYLAGDWGHFEEPAWRLKLGSLGLMLPVVPVASVHV